MTKPLLLASLLVLLSGCTALGAAGDMFFAGKRVSDNEPAENTSYDPKDVDETKYLKNYGLTLTELGYEIDKAILSGAKKENEKNVELKCRRITDFIKECVEVETPATEEESIERRFY